MTLQKAVFMVAILMTALTALGALAYVITKQRRKAKRSLRWFEFAAMLYVVVIYSLGLAGMQMPLLRSGILTVFAMVIVSGLLLAEIVLDWKRE